MTTGGSNQLIKPSSTSGAAPRVWPCPTSTCAIYCRGGFQQLDWLVLWWQSRCPQGPAQEPLLLLNGGAPWCWRGTGQGAPAPSRHPGARACPSAVQWLDISILFIAYLYTTEAMQMLSWQ